MLLWLLLAWGEMNYCFDSREGLDAKIRSWHDGSFLGGYWRRALGRAFIRSVALARDQFGLWAAYFHRSDLADPGGNTPGRFASSPKLPISSPVSLGVS